MKAGTLHFAALLGGASAHTIFTNLVDGSTVYDVGHGIRVPNYDGPIQDVTTDYIACNGGPNPTTPSDKIITVQAGSTVQATWRHTLDSGPEDVIDASHLGPVMAYMKKVDDAVSDDGIGDGWFKISEDGLDSSGEWAVTKLIANQGLQDIPIPACLENGEYLLRAEIIALHGASAPGGAQFYMECAQLKVEGGAGGASPATISLPGEYSADDPGITVNIYGDLASYEIPGPEVFSC